MSGSASPQSFFYNTTNPKRIKRGLARFLWRVAGDVVTYTRGDKGTCYGWGWGFGPCAPSGRGTARGTATVGAGAAATATATGRVASRATRSRASAERGARGARIWPKPDDRRGVESGLLARKLEDAGQVRWSRRAAARWADEVGRLRCPAV